jgi:hypothetical protein
MEAKGWSGRQLAAELAVSQAAVVKALALLELPGTVQAQVEQGTLAPSAAYQVAKLSDPADQERVAQAVVDEGLRRDEVAELVRAVKTRRPAPPTRPDPVAVDVDEVATVTVRWKRGGGGGLTAVQVLKKALKQLQDRERGGRAA